MGCDVVVPDMLATKIERISMSEDCEHVRERHWSTTYSGTKLMTELCEPCLNGYWTCGCCERVFGHVEPMLRFYEIGHTPENEGVCDDCY